MNTLKNFSEKFMYSLYIILFDIPGVFTNIVLSLFISINLYPSIEQDYETKNMIIIIISLGIFQIFGRYLFRKYFIVNDIGIVFDSKFVWNKKKYFRYYLNKKLEKVKPIKLVEKRKLFKIFKDILTKEVDLNIDILYNDKRSEFNLNFKDYSKILEIYNNIYTTYMSRKTYKLKFDFKPNLSIFELYHEINFTKIDKHNVNELKLKIRNIYKDILGYQFEYDKDKEILILYINEMFISYGDLVEFLPFNDYKELYTLIKSYNLKSLDKKLDIIINKTK